MANLKNKVAVADCPECGTTIRFHQSLKLGQVVTCPECDERLQVEKLNPLELDWAFDGYDNDYDEEWD